MQGIPRGIRCAVYDKVVANPTITNIEEARTLYLESGTKAIIAFGGGSAMDCAKVTGACIVKPNKPIHKMKGLLRICKKLPLLIAVLTTAGTGSETTLAAVITDSGAKHKYPINDFSLIPRYAVLDYHVTLGLPKNITTTTGMDALTHAVETYIGRSTTKETRFMAEQATRLIYKNLKTAYDDGQSLVGFGTNWRGVGLQHTRGLFGPSVNHWSIKRSPNDTKLDRRSTGSKPRPLGKSRSNPEMFNPHTRKKGRNDHRRRTKHLNAKRTTGKMLGCMRRTRMQLQCT